jgi:transposase-like protein
MYMCNSCRQPFSVTVGTIMEKSHIPLNKWVLGFHLMASSKKGVSAHQLHRQLGITYKAAWFMAHRIREAMAPASGSEPPLGGEGKTVEADETEISGSYKTRTRRTRAGNIKVMSLVERGGRVRSVKITGRGKAELQEIITANVDKKTRLMTDTASAYQKKDMGFAAHETVNHAKGEYARGDATTNTVERYFSLFKRGLVGTYHHMSEQHIQRYLNEFDFRQGNRAALGLNDTMRAERIIKGAEGKRLTYHAVSG